jgi:hypothetical protein
MKKNTNLATTADKTIRKIEKKYPKTVEVAKGVTKLTYNLLVFTTLVKFYNFIKLGELTALTIFTFIGTNGYLLIGVIVLTMFAKIFIKPKDKTAVVVDVVGKILDKLF